ncbi:UNVERIFIED_CONTAM: hypothetical protein NCL1_54704 [Trichonephila clavipes]
MGGLADSTWTRVERNVTPETSHLMSRREESFLRKKQGTQKLETGPGCEETQKESIRTSPESVVANGRC